MMHDRHCRAARRRNRVIKARMLRWQALGLIPLGLIALATLGFAQLTDRAAQGVTDCRTLHLAQCPEFLR